DGGSLLRLSDQCLDVVFGRIGSDVEMNANGAKPIAHLVIHPEDALNIHVGLECCLDRMELNAASLRDCCYTGRKAARQTGEDKLNGSWSIVFGRKDLRVVRLDSERLVAGLLSPQPEEVADNGAAVGAVQPRAARAPLELCGLWCLFQGLTRAEQRTHVDPIVRLRDGRNGRGHAPGLCFLCYVLV